MAKRKTIYHLAIQQEEPSRNSVWINPYNGVARFHAGKRGWVVLQGPLFAQLNAKLDTDVQTLTGRIEEDEKSIKTNADDIAKLKTSKQDALTAGYGIYLAEDGTISCTVDTSVFVFKETLPDRPDEGKEDKIYIVPSEKAEDGNACDEWVWVADETEDNGGHWELFGSGTLSVDLGDYAKKSDFDALKTYLDGLKNSVEELQTANGTLSEKVTELQTANTALEERVKKLEEEDGSGTGTGAGGITGIEFDTTDAPELTLTPSDEDTVIKVTAKLDLEEYAKKSDLEEYAKKEDIPEVTEMSAGDVDEKWKEVMNQ